MCRRRDGSVMGKRLFAREEDRQRAVTTLQTFRGQLADYSNKDVRWVVKKLKTIRNNAPVEMAVALRKADTEYIAKTHEISARRGASSPRTDGVVAGKVSSRYTSTDWGGDIDALDKAEKKHRAEMQKLNVFFKINSFLRDLTLNLFSDLRLSPEQEEAFVQLQTLLCEKQYKSIGDLLLDTTDSVKAIRDTLGEDEKKVYNALYYQQKQGKIRMIDLTDEEIAFILEQEYPCTILLSSIRPVLEYYFDNGEDMTPGKGFALSEANAALWDLWNRNGSDVSVFEAKDYRLRPMTDLGRFRGYL